MAEFTAIETQEQFDKAIGERLQRERAKLQEQYEAENQALKTENADLKAQLTETRASLEDFQGKSTGYDQQISDLTNQVKGYVTEKLKMKVAMEAGIPFSLANRIQGDSEESIRQDAEILAGYFKTQNQVLPLASTEPQGMNSEDSAYLALLEGLNLEGE